MLHGETVSSVADPSGTHTPGSGHTFQLNTPEIMASDTADVTASPH